MSFSWKGLLGVNQSSASSSLASPGTSTSNNASTAPSSNAPSHTTSASAATTSTAASSTSAASSAMSPSASRSPLNANPYSATQSPAPAVPLFGGMMPGSTSYHSTSYIPSSSSTTQSSLVSRKPSEIPLNAVEGGGYLLGMENFGNTCYVNSVMQSLYFCRPFRDSVLSYKASGRERSESDPSSTNGLLSIGDLSSRSPPETAAQATDGVPPSDTLFASLRDLFEVIQQSGHHKALSSPTRSTAPGSLPLASPLSPSPPAAGAAEQPAVVVARKTSILGRPSTAGAVAGRGGSGSHTVSSATVSAGATAAQAIPITPNSVAGSGPPNLSISTSSAGTLASGFPSVDSSAVKSFLTTLKRENVLFDSTMHQDAHEMLNFVLNKVGEDLIDADKAKSRVKMQSRNPYLNTRTASDKTIDALRKRNVMEVGPNGKTCVHRLFEGVLTNETRCLTCETVTSRDECFLDLSIDIDKNSSVTSCLRQFSASEMLRSRNKFFCDSCSGLQEAEKRMKIKKLPNVLALHLKRFKYEETVQRYVKLAYRVVFPHELRLFNTSDDAEDPDRLYELCAIVVHIGAGPHHGHYIAVVKVGDRWVQFDDDVVTYIDEAELTKYYGDRPGLGSAYVLFYQAVDLDFDGLGLEDPALQASAQQRAASGVTAEARGRAGLKVPDMTDPRGNISPDRSGAAATANRPRLDSVTEGSPLVSVGAGQAEPGQGGNGWFGSFRKRAGSQSRRRPKTASALEPTLGNMPSLPGLPVSSTHVDLAKHTAPEGDGARPDNVSAPMQSAAANDSASRGTTVLASSAATPATEGVPSTHHPQPLTSASNAGVEATATSPMRNGFTSINAASTVSSDANVTRATTESPSESKYDRMLGNQADAAANRVAREQNLMRGAMNRRARAASEGFPSSGMVVEAPLSLGPLVAEPEDGRVAVVTPSAVDPDVSAASSSTSPQREASTGGSGFAPLERLMSSKQKAQAKTARRASSSYSPMSPTAERADKKDGMLSNLFSSSSSSSSSAAQSKRNSMQQLGNGASPNVAGGGEEAGPPTRKPSISTRTFSKTFGFGRKNG
ncbi:ubiquitin carboxyl-terminal hydrolase [Pseudozyma hubeiensis SY62]|uniref:ubiquitinyl hydrolase 1 n=1 Tax=Pseudozyma hubeiensis (strain SY62) TaxID=1305764 RepID=R9P2Q8_PSEHS|nr:ubiquitin carboxyl-terminal hydrolase [Pseudozyma hubeiensis SY62]GAC95517.1 ubiquitin carboxyl-terminal hydrolase [Pseudozyma hubeiensis SY62]